MTGSRYEKYIVREPTRAQHGVSLSAWSTVKDARTAPPYMLVENGKPIYVEVVELEGETALVRALPIFKDGRPIAQFPFPERKSNAKVLVKSLREVYIYR